MPPPVLKSSSIASRNARRWAATSTNSGTSPGSKSPCGPLRRRRQAVETLAGDPLVALEEAVERLQAGADLPDAGFAEVDRAAVMGREEEEPDRLAGELLEHVAEGAGALGLADLARLLRGEIAFGRPGLPPAELAHLVRSLHQAVVHPVLGHGACRGAIRSGRFRFRGAERRGPARRRGCRTSRPAGGGSWRSTRCASRAGRCPRGWATRARPAWPPSTGRNRPLERFRAAVPPPSPCMASAVGGR